MKRIRRPFRPGQQTFLALLFFWLVSGLMLAPLFVYFFDRLPAGGDALEYLWKLWWFKHSLLDVGQSPWVAPEIFYPRGYLLAYGEITPSNTILALPLTSALGEIPTYNFLVVFSVAMSGFAMFLLARQVSGSFWAGLLAGVIFAFAPFRRLHVMHLNILSTQWLPLIFYFLERFRRAHRPADGLAAGIAFALNALASWYYAVFGMLGVGVWMWFRLRPLNQYWRSAAARLGWLLFGLTAVVLIAPFVWPYLAVVGRADTAIPMENSNFYAASPVEYVLPSPFQFLWGRWVYRNLFSRPEPGEFILGWGWMAWLFAWYGLRFAPRWLTRGWLMLTLLAVVLSFGLTLHLAGRQVVIPASPAVVDAVNRALDTVSQNYALSPEPFTIGEEHGLIVPMPALALRWFVPIVGRLRTWTRFGIMALLGVTVLAAIGAAVWHRREVAGYSPVRKRLAWGAVLGLALFELWWYPPAMVQPTLARPVDRWLAAQQGQFAVMQYPLNSAFTAEQLIYARAHGKPIVHGYATYFSFVFSRQYPDLLTFPAPESVRKLAQLGVRYVLVDTSAPYRQEAGPLLVAARQTPCLQLKTVQADVYVFELVGCNR